MYTETGGVAELARAVAARGNNLVLLAPPSPSHARAVLAGVLGRPATGAARRLALAPVEAVDEWARVAAQEAEAAGHRVAGAHTPARLARLLQSSEYALLLTSPDTAFELVRRAALKLGDLDALLLLWPERWGGDEALAALLADLPKETQRIIVTADPATAAPVIERYSWRAQLEDLLGADPLSGAPAVRVLPVSWARRAESLLDLVEQLDPASLAVWVADPADAAGIERVLAAGGVTASIGSGIPAAGSLVVAYDLPSPGRLRELGQAGEVVLLAPPGTEAYVARLSPQRKPLTARGPLGGAQAELTRTRRAIMERLEQGAAAPAYFALAPLLERFDAVAVAATLYSLWQEAGARAEPSAPVRPPPSGSKLWVGAGKRDAISPNELVAVLIKDAGVARAAIGKVEVRETFSIVELGAGTEVEAVAERLTGKTVKKRRLVARADRGRSEKVKRER